MRYVVDAVICDGKPCLRVIDTRDDSIRLQWSLDRSDHVPARGSAVPQGKPESGNMQALLKNLFLIACHDDLGRNLPSHNNRETRTIDWN